MNRTNKLLIIIFIITLTITYYDILYAFNAKAKTTIELQDKNNNILANLSFTILNENGEFVENAVTNENGIYQTILDKGQNYLIKFNYMNKDWKFNLSVPNKPGPRSYKFNFKVSIETDLQTILQGKTKFDEKVDKTLCKTKIILSDESDMPLPLQEFTVKSLDSEFHSKLKTDSNGIAYIVLKNEQTYDVQTLIEGYIFNTSFHIPVETIETEFNYEIDFTKISNFDIETTQLQFPVKYTDSLKTIIIVQDSTGKKLKDIEVLLEESNKRVFKGITSNDGQVQTYTYREKVYELYVRKDFRTYKFELVLPKDINIKEYTFIAIVDFEFKPKRTFVLNINFDSGKWDLRDEDIPEMDDLFQQMMNNPRMIIELGGHTDAIGSEKSNQILSEKRANTCFKYLIDKGIEKGRVKAKGYGETRPVATNKTKEGRFLNRRMEVSILNE